MTTYTKQMKSKIKNREFIHNITSLRKDLSIVLIFAISTIGIIDFWQVNTTEIFTGGYKLGQIANNICLSYISAFIFYFFVVHLQNQKDKKNLYSYFSRYAQNIILKATDVSRDLATKSNTPLGSNYPTKEELNLICRSIDPNSDSPLFLGIQTEKNHPNWIQYFANDGMQQSKYSEKILSKDNSILDSNFVRILTEIENCSLFNIVNILVENMPKGDKLAKSNLSFIEAPLFEYFELIKELELYYNKALKYYHT